MGLHELSLAARQKVTVSGKPELHSLANSGVIVDCKRKLSVSRAFCAIVCQLDKNLLLPYQGKL